ncbi:MAG: hypothetical protein JST54_32400 [Deltaproteobacteria bacterium]|nr:hypothetical protein [Deltaproteobacteria bacterium]
MSRKSNVDDGAGQLTGSQALVQKFLKEAMAIPAKDVRPMNGDPQLAAKNARDGVNTLLPYAAQLRKELPKVQLDKLRAVPEMAQALIFAANQVTLTVAPAGQTKALVSQANQLRNVMLSSADSLANAAILPPTDVAKIHKGRGSMDAANDLIALAALFQKNAGKVKGKTPVDATMIKQADALGSQLLSLLQPAGAKRQNKKTAEQKRAADLRDRLWTLMLTTWDQHVWRSGAWIFGRDVDANVPPLLARAGTPRSSKDGSGNGGPPSGPTGNAPNASPK